MVRCGEGWTIDNVVRCGVRWSINGVVQCGVGRDGVCGAMWDGVPRM